ncbi:methyltransferase domain-containing protein [Abyssogena phaseoliformis symbiont]|uniref:methyltransferase domain-containing protein n=1 Tax=Abyssogena phaseoliformis symbiont TaxID=596095 RepID=UPI00191606EB
MSPNAIGLDFGSGSSPTLCVMFLERGYHIDLFDKFYANDTSIFNNYYNFITLTEVAEHFDKPGFELDRLFAMLDGGGVLSIMTNMLNSDTNFEYWHYKDDPTHICFFSQMTMNYLANKWDARIKFYGDDVVLFFK